MKGTILAFDPGDRETGIVALDEDDEVVRSKVVERENDAWEPYLHAVLLELADPPMFLEYVAIEDAVPPRAFMGGEYRPISPSTILGLARCFGAIVGACMALGLPYVIVRPAKNGKLPLEHYRRVCPELVGPRETKGTSGRLRHLRSAFDVGIAARKQLRPCKTCGKQTREAWCSDACFRADQGPVVAGDIEEEPF